MTTVKTNLEAGVAHDVGSALQCSFTPAALGLATTVPNGGSVQSSVMPSNGWQKGAVGLKSTQAGNLTVQRYLDAAGTIPVGAAITAALSANTAGYVSWNDGLVFGSFQVTVSNSGGSNATISSALLVLQAG